MLYLISHTRLRAHRAHGIPCALFRGQVTGDRQDSRKNMRRECGGVSQMTVSESVGWAKAPLRRAHHVSADQKWWARFALPTLRLRLCSVANGAVGIGSSSGSDNRSTPTRRSKTFDPKSMSRG